MCKFVFRSRIEAAPPPRFFAWSWWGEDAPRACTIEQRALDSQCGLSQQNDI